MVTASAPEAAALRVKYSFEPSSSRQREPSGWMLPRMVSMMATPSSTFQEVKSVSSPSNSAAVPSSLRVRSMTISKSSKLKVSPSISMDIPCHSPKKGSPSAPTGRAGSGVGAGVGSGMGSHFTAASSASTSGSCAGSVMQSSRAKYSTPNSSWNADSLAFST